jgi:bacterioferritin
MRPRAEVAEMSQRLIETLNHLLVGALAASNRCLAHAELCDEHGYARLLEAYERRAQEEMGHARALIGRLISLRARPVPRQEPLSVDSDIAQQIRTEMEAVKRSLAGYQEGIRLASELGDEGTRKLLEQILEDLRRQQVWLQSQAAQMEQMGLQAYLRLQV